MCQQYFHLLIRQDRIGSTNIWSSKKKTFVKSFVEKEMDSSDEDKVDDKEKESDAMIIAETYWSFSIN